MKKPLAYCYQLFFVLLILGFFHTDVYTQCNNNDPSSPVGIIPTTVGGNPALCTGGIRIDPPTPGTYNLDAFGNTVTFSIANDPDCGEIMAWEVSSGIVMDKVIAKGGANGANIFDYTAEDPSPNSDGFLHTPVNPSGKYADFSHIDFCFHYKLDILVVDPPLTSYTRTYEWEIDKSVDPDNWNMFTGDSGTSEYTVSVDKTGFTDSDWAVEGMIFIENNTPFDATIESIGNMISGIGIVGPDCPVTFPYLLVSGGSLECSYTTALPDGSDRVNTTTVTTSGAVDGGSDSADITFGDPTTEVDASINVTDTNGDTWGPVSDDDSWTYSKTFTCNDDEGEYNNTATIDETGQEASALVTVTCYGLEVTKDAETTFDRNYEWAIDKTGYDESGEAATELTLSTEQSYEVDYEVVLSAGFTDDNYMASGEISVYNPAPVPATINSVTDLVAGLNATVVCGVIFPYELGPDETLTCDYSVSLDDETTQTNTATATLQNTPAGTTDFSGTAEVNFDDAIISEYDECINLTDDQNVALDEDICYADLTGNPLSYTVSYSLVVGPYDDCGDYSYTNIATFVTNDNSTTGSSSWTVDIVIPCEGGCTRTLGYWKTHSDYGPAPYDETWGTLGDLDNDGILEYEDEDFYLSGKTWYEVLWTPPAGNPYYIIARQYIATYMNELSGASVPSEVSDAMEYAEDEVFTLDPSVVKTWKGRDKKDLTKNAGILDDYNNGEIGPGHCDEDASSGDDGGRLTENALSLEKDYFVVYPNPAEHIIFVDIILLEGEKGKLTISDQLGRVVYNNRLNNLDDLILKIDLTEYGIRPGMYFISLETKEDKYVEKVMVISSE